MNIIILCNIHTLYGVSVFICICDILCNIYVCIICPESCDTSCSVISY